MGKTYDIVALGELLVDFTPAGISEKPVEAADAETAVPSRRTMVSNNATILFFMAFRSHPNHLYKAGRENPPVPPFLFFYYTQLFPELQ